MEKGIRSAFVGLGAFFVISGVGVGELPVVGEILAPSIAEAGKVCYRDSRGVMRCKQRVWSEADRRAEEMRRNGSFRPLTGSCSYLSRKFDRDIIALRRKISRVRRLYGRGSERDRNLCSQMCLLLRNEYNHAKECGAPTSILATIKGHRERFCIKTKRRKR